MEQTGLKGSTVAGSRQLGCSKGGGEHLADSTVDVVASIHQEFPLHTVHSVSESMSSLIIHQYILRVGTCLTGVTQYTHLSFIIYLTNF